MIALQSPQGLVFGSAQGIDHDTVTVALVGHLNGGQSVEFRMELPGLDETALGVGRVVSGRGERGGASTFQI